MFFSYDLAKILTLGDPIPQNTGQALGTTSVFSYGFLLIGIIIIFMLFLGKI